MNGCLFCNLWHEKNRVLWENEFLYLVFDNCPVSPGHALLIPKRHVKDFMELDEAEWKELRPGGGVRFVIPEMGNYKIPRR